MDRETKQILTRLYREIGSLGTQVAEFSRAVAKATTAMQDLTEALQEGKDDAEEEHHVQEPGSGGGD